MSPPAALLPLVCEQRRALARRCLGAAVGETPQATALVHEAWLEVSRDLVAAGADRAALCAAAARAMRTS